MTIRLLLDILKSRFMLILVTLLVTVAVAAVFTMREQKRYTATTSLVLGFDDAGPFEQSALPAQLSSTYLATQLDIVRSQKVALKVVEHLKLDEEAGWREAYKESDAGGVPIKEWIAGMIMANLRVEPLQNSRVVRVSYAAKAPGDAARMANAYADAFIATTLELTLEPARRNAAWFDEQAKALRARLETARARMSELQSQKGIVALDERLGAETTRLDDISRNLVQAQMATAAARSRQLGENHPEYRSALQREYALQAQLEAQKRNILRLQGQRDELDTLARELESEQRVYDATLQSYYKTAMESQFNQTNIAVLSPALPPTKPSSPNVLLNMISAVAVGLFLGLVLAMLAEMANPKARSLQIQRRFIGEPLPEL